MSLIASRSIHRRATPDTAAAPASSGRRGLWTAATGRFCGRIRRRRTGPATLGRRRGVTAPAHGSPG